MADLYRIFGAEMSPYSVKVRSYFRYKAIPHQWILRNAASQAEYDKHAKLPIVPLVVTPDGTGIQDSTPIIDQMEKLFPEPPIHPNGVAGFISALIEEFGDEWGNKWMFHYRWTRDVDQICSAGRIARMRVPRASEDEFAGFAGQPHNQGRNRGGLDPFRGVGAGHIFAVPGSIHGPGEKHVRGHGEIFVLKRDGPDKGH